MSADETMINMKRPKKGAAGSEYASTSPELQEPEYPWGLMLRLEKAELEKLGIKIMPGVGQVVSIEARGVVESVHQSQSMHNQGDRCVSIQLTDIALTQGEDTDKD